MAEHPIVGAALVEPLLGTEVAQAVLRHHERVDGKGYPSRLTGTQIPLASRIIQICDAWVAMTAPTLVPAADLARPGHAADARRRGHAVRRGAGAAVRRRARGNRRVASAPPERPDLPANVDGQLGRVRHPPGRQAIADAQRKHVDAGKVEAVVAREHCRRAALRQARGAACSSAEALARRRQCFASGSDGNSRFSIIVAPPSR